jgi:hypothetical protein
MPDPGATRFWLTIGVLDARAVSKLREILSGLAAQPGIGLTVDLTTLDDYHHLTASALLSGTAYRMRDHDSTLTAHNPPGDLILALAAIPVPVTYGQPLADGEAGTHIRVGAGQPLAEAARSGSGFTNAARWSPSAGMITARMPTTRRGRLRLGSGADLPA